MPKPEVTLRRPGRLSPRLQLTKRLKTRATPACRCRNRSGCPGFASLPIEGMPMFVPDVHQYGGTWVFYVVAPVVLCGVVACLWWIVKGAIGVFGRTPRS